MKYLLALLCAGCGTMYEVGPEGPQGPAGQDGQSPLIIFTRFTSDSEVCLAGSGVIARSYHMGLFASEVTDSVAILCDGINGKDGAVGEQGDQGDQGAKGDKGEKGNKGDQGNTGASAPISPYEVTQIIDPCGDAPGIFDEVFLKMANGTLIASFSDNANGNNTRLSILTPGSYVTTDGSNCHIVVHSDGTVTW